MVRESKMSKISEVDISLIRHELRTPINHIVGYAELLQEEAEDLGEEELFPALHCLWTSGQSLLRLVNAALDTAEAEPNENWLPGLRQRMHQDLVQIIGTTREIAEYADVRGRSGLIGDVQKVCLAAYNLMELANHETLASALSQMQLNATCGVHIELSEGKSNRPPSPMEESQHPLYAGTARVIPRPINGVPASILVVEDNETSRAMLCRRLERQGHLVAEAENGRVALEMVARIKFDLILLDVMMPEIDGYQALRKLKSTDLSRHIPVIMLSALGEMNSVVKCVELGAEDYLSKPFNPVLLKARIDASLEKKRLRDLEVLNLKKIESMNARLERRVEDRVRELKQSNDQLVLEVAHRKKLEEDLRDQMAEMAVADEIARIVTSTLDFGQAYEEFALELKKLVSFDRMSVNLIDHDSKTLVTTYLYGVDGLESQIGEPDPLAGTAADEVRKTGKPVFRQDNRNGLHCSPDSEYELDWLRSSVDMPLASNGEVIGVLGLGSRQIGAYGAREQTILARVAKQIAPAIDNAGLFEATTREKERATRTLAQLRALLDGVDAGILLMGTDDDTVLWSNQRFAQLFEKDQARPPVDAPVGRQEINRLLRNCLANPEEEFERTDQIIADRSYSGTQELEFINPEPRTIQRFTTPVYQDLGEYLGRLWVYYDVTEQRRVERQLLQSQKMESVGRLAGGIAHDFNNLLTPIMGYASLSAMALPPGHVSQGYLEEVTKAAERASGLAHQLLTFSKGRITQTRVTDLNTLVHNIGDLLRPITREDIEVVTLLAGDLALVKVDPGQIEQVLLNLVINASDAMPNGGKLTIETANVRPDQKNAGQHCSGDAGQYVMISVRDNGTGITKEVKAHIFEPFFTTKDPGKGTGLGLSTCYGIVKQSGGHIDVSSTPGQGTIFRVYLPATDETADDTPLDPDDGSLPRGTETVLVVEDEPSVRGMVATILSGQGYTVLEASTGQEALRVAEENSGANIALLLTDVVMAQMGGVKLAGEFRSNHPEVKVILISGYADQPIDPKITSGPEYDIIRKPFMPGVLAKKVREVLDRY
jgi:signal transduction histidine kinase/DNA-binding response OmpR family regulator